MKINELKDKSILILGFGKEGRNTFGFLRKIFPDKVLGIGDRLEFEKLNQKAKKILYPSFHCVKKHFRDREKYFYQGEKYRYNRHRCNPCRLHLGKNYLRAIKDYDIIIKSPGIPPKVVGPFISKSQRLTSQTEIFFENCSGRIIGITGTKGKSTTATLIYQILKTARLKAHLVGNIGKPVLNLLFSARPKDIYVYELSSHQLYNLKKSSQIAVFLNIYPEHLDYYQNFQEYLKAKQNITRYQKKEDYFVYNSNDLLVKKTTEITKAKKIPIKEKYYELNKVAARAVGEIFKIPKTTIEKAIGEFKPLAHRLEYVGTYKGIKFYNDALSTIPETTIAAIDTLGGDLETIFLGGFDRGLDFKNLAKRVLKSKIKNLILFPTTGEKIWQEIVSLKRNNKLKTFLVQNMRNGVKLAYQHTKKGKICLLSCASTSFSIFRDYKEKGNLFKKYVRKYAQ